MIQQAIASAILFVIGIPLNLAGYVSSVLVYMFAWSLFYVRKFPDLCLSSQIRHVDPPTVYAETLLRAVHEPLQDAKFLPVVVQLILEVMFMTAAYDPVYRICKTALFWLLRFLPESVQRYFDYYAWGVSSMNYLLSTLMRCVFVGFMREIWEAHYTNFDFPDPKEIVEKSVVLIFVKFCLGAPESLICLYWTLKITYQYIFKFQGKTYEDLLLLSLLFLIYVAIVEWMEGFYALSSTYLFISYMIYFYWLLSS